MDRYINAEPKLRPGSEDEIAFDEFVIFRVVKEANEDRTEMTFTRDHIS